MSERGVLEGRGLWFGYQPGEPILRGIDLIIERGQFVSIQGASGSGKSTLLYVLGTLLAPQKGDVVLAGVSLGASGDSLVSRLRHEHIGFVFQSFHLLPGLSVLENVMEPARWQQGNHWDPASVKKRAEGLLERVGLGGLEDRMPSTLSGGQCQRVAIARALLPNPSVLLCDEPTGALDSKTAQDVLDLLISLNADGTTLVVVTHDPAVASRAGRQIRVRDGTLESDELLTKTAAAEPAAPCAPHASRMVPSLRLTDGRTRPTSARDLPRGLKVWLTSLGVTLGVGALFSMISLGHYAGSQVLKSYEGVGVGIVEFTGYRSQGRSNSGSGSSNLPRFFAFSEKNDVRALKQTFSEAASVALYYRVWGAQLKNRTPDGLQVDDPDLVGFSEDSHQIFSELITSGRWFSDWDHREKSRVCVIADGLATRLFPIRELALGQSLQLREDANQPVFQCTVIGTAAFAIPQWVVMPGSTLSSLVTHPWYRLPHTLLIRAESGVRASELATATENFFRSRYSGGRFSGSSNLKLQEGMQVFITLFTLLLGAVAASTLVVGTVGIVNLLLAQLAEKTRELALQRALGASRIDIQRLVWWEGAQVTGVSGFMGILLGWLSLELGLWGLSHVIPSVPFQWIFDPWALAAGILATFASAWIAGILPAWRIDRMDVARALRMDG